MALIAVAADKGAPGVTTASLALAAVWPRPVLLAECDAAGGDLLYRLPAAHGGRLDPQRGLLSLAVAARRGLQPHQVWRHTQKLHGGLDVLTGLVNAEQAAGIQLLWGQIGRVLSDVAEVDVIADCGRLGPDGPFYDLLARAAAVVLVTRVTLEDVVRLRDRVVAVSRALANRRLASPVIGVVVVAQHNHFKRSLAEVGHALSQTGAPARIVGGLADDHKSAQMLRGEWGTRLDRSLLVRSARELAIRLAGDVPVRGAALAASATQPAEHSVYDAGPPGSPVAPAGRQTANVPPSARLMWLKKDVPSGPRGRTPGTPEAAEPARPGLPLVPLAAAPVAEGAGVPLAGMPAPRTDTGPAWPAVTIEVGAAPGAEARMSPTAEASMSPAAEARDAPKIESAPTAPLPTPLPTTESAPGRSMPTGPAQRPVDLDGGVGARQEEPARALQGQREQSWQEESARARQGQREQPRQQQPAQTLQEQREQSWQEESARALQGQREQPWQEESARTRQGQREQPRQQQPAQTLQEQGEQPLEQREPNGQRTSTTAGT